MANKILNKKIESIDFSKIFLQVVVDRKSDFTRATCKKGVTVSCVGAYQPDMQEMDPVIL